MAAGAAMLANTMTAAPVSTILFSVCLNIFDPLSSRISVVTHVTCEANIAVAGTRGDQPMGWLSTVERMRFCINRSVESMDTNRYQMHHHLVQKLTPSSELGSYRYRIHRISERDCPKRVCWVVIGYSSTHEKALPNRPLRCRVEVHSASPAYSKSCREAQKALLTRDS